ncbi:MAG: adenylate/guanylate cyclase domain-containing protein [Burkholderiales bacterium]|nr:adenylate/guanylate cyclase domain-containing protein [Burkholderiales bacterium]MDP2398253.1 adenylate/guanylate cyclase domain-containing protein [Burkholderiales bacterium]
MKVGSKIFGVAAVLVAGTTAVALYSLDRIAQLNREVVTIASYHAPLSRILSEVEVHARNRELAFYNPARGNAARTDDAGATGKAVDAAMQRALALARDGQQRAQSEDDRLKFAGLNPLLETVAAEYRELDARLLAAQGGAGGADPVALALIDKEITDLNRALTEVNGRLHRMTEESAMAAAGHEDAARRFNLGLTLLSGVVAVLLAFLLSRSLVGPLLRLVRATGEVRQGARDFEPVIHSRDEIQVLAQAFRDMLLDLRAKERIREKLGKYIDPRIADRIVEHTGNAGSIGERQEMTVMFTDMQGFTSISESLLPTTLVKLLNRYFELMSAPVSANSGVIDKYIGDAVMAFWGQPFCDRQSQASLACATALAQIEALAQLRAELPEILGMRRGLPEIAVRAGIATGDVVVGNLGSSVAQGYTVVGDTVNLASRLESLNKAYGTRILVCETTWAGARADFEGREVDQILVVGKENPVRCYEILGRRGEVAAEPLRMRDCFEQGLAAYRARHNAAAREAFSCALEALPGDACSQVFIDRLDRIGRDPMPADWDGVWRHTGK